MRRLWIRGVRAIADLRLAIVLLLAIALVSISGTVIEQGRSVAFYQENYPEDPAVFGFLSWKVILLLGLDHVYSTVWFIALLVVFGASLTACTFTRQLPTLKTARNWKYYEKPKSFEKLALSTQIDRADLASVAPLLEQKSYKIFQEGDKLYARKGIVGRIGPIVVHASMLIILAGAIFGSLTGFMAQEMVPSGQSFLVRNIIEAGPWSRSRVPQDWGIRVNRFWIDYTDEGNIDQFYSDLSVIDLEGEELDRQTIHVNQPLRYNGVTFYQADWSVAAVRVRINRSPVFQLPMAQLPQSGGGKLWGTWVPIKPDMSEGISLLTRDLQGTLLVYDVEGNLAGAIRTGMSAKVNGVTLHVLDLVGSTGLQIKVDPGIPIVYAGFGLLMLGVVMSYVSHSQVWALQSGNSLYFGGKTNRAQLTFERELLTIIEQLEKQESSQTLGESVASKG